MGDDPGDTLVQTMHIRVLYITHTHMLLIAMVAVMESYPNQLTSVYRATTLGNIVRVHL